MKCFVLLLAGCVSFTSAAEKLARDTNFFPLAVWVQSPRNAERFKAAGINTYVGLWRGPTEEQFTQLKTAGMKLICSQNEFALAHKDDPMIIAWMQGDEPDNAQSLGQGKGYGPPILPEKTIERYQKMRATDPTHPILLNMGQGVAWDNYIGRGVRRNHPEDYAEYVKGGDIVSFDIYPATHDHPDIKGKLEYVAKGVQRLKKWAGDEREVWNCVEAKLGDGDARVTPSQLHAEVWMSIIHGSRGIIYFVHQFKPVFREASVFEDADLLKAVTDVNKQVTDLAPVLNSPALEVKIETKRDSGSVAATARKNGNDFYVFAVAMSAQPASCTFALPSADADYRVEVLGENRNAANIRKSYTDQFAPYQVHLYRFTRAH